MFACVADPGLMPAAVEELLRYDSPVQGVSRVATGHVFVLRRIAETGAEAAMVLRTYEHSRSRFIIHAYCFDLFHRVGLDGNRVNLH